MAVVSKDVVGERLVDRGRAVQGGVPVAHIGGRNQLQVASGLAEGEAVHAAPVRDGLLQRALRECKTKTDGAANASRRSQ